VISLTWIEELVLKRNAQRSNCYIIETVDPRRVAEFKEILGSGKFGELVKTDYVRLLDYDIQRGEIVDLKDKAPLRTDPMSSPISQIGQLLADAPTVLTVKYVYNESHANMISEMLVAWSHDEELYNHKSTVVVFTSSASLFSESVRRFVHTISVEPSTPEERRAILRKIAEDLSVAFEEKYGRKLRLRINEDLIQATSGLTLHDVESAALESFYTTRKFDVKVFTSYKVQLLRNYGIRYVLPKRGFETIGGYDLLKNYVKDYIIDVLRNPEEAEYYGISIPKGIILAGFHGCGKTFFARAMAKEVGLPMVEMSSATFLRGIVGETERRVQEITGIVESLAPVIVFIDEIDEIALRRDQTMITDSGVRRSMQNLLMRWLGDEERKSFIVGATNLIETVDPAFIRAGRIDDIVLILPPDRKAREEILNIHTNVLRKVPLDSSVDFSRIADKTFMWTGAELEKLVLFSARLAKARKAKKVSQEHFEETMKMFSVGVDVTARKQAVQRTIQVMKKLENVNYGFLKEALRVFIDEERDKSRVKGLMETL